MMVTVPTFNYNIYNIDSDHPYKNFEDLKGFAVKLNYASAGNPTTDVIVKELNTDEGSFYEVTKFDGTALVINPTHIISITPVKVVKGTYEYTNKEGVLIRVHRYFKLNLREDYCYRDEKGNNILKPFESETFRL